MPRLLALVLTLSSAWSYGLVFPTVSWRPLAWIVLVPFFSALRGASLGWSLFLGWAWTTGAAYAVGDWFAPAIARYYEQPFVVGLAFFFGVSGLMAAPFYMTFAACYRVLVRRPTPATPFLAAAAWVAAELGRARLVGNPWALFGYSQIGSDALVQIADLGGVYGVTFVLVVMNAMLAELVARTPTGQHRRATAVGVVGLVAAALAYGQWRLRDVAAPTRPDDTTVTVGMAQANLELGALWDPARYGSNLDVYLALTHELLARNTPKLIVWPESALTFFLEDEPLYRATIARALGDREVELIAGGPRAVPAAPHAYYNSMFHLGATGTIESVYDKQRLVPFAEYFPFGSIDLLRRRFARVREFSPGPPQPPFRTQAGVAGITICNEAMFPEIAAERVREGAQFLVDPAHDTWLTPRFSAQQFDIVRLRTVEQRRWLVRASTSGPSAIVDPWGRVVTRTEFETRAALDGTIHLRDDRTPYNRLGDAFAGACLLAAVGGWSRAPRAEGRVRRPRPDSIDS